jgi:REP element-mobilizing transposase RayT
MRRMSKRIRIVTNIHNREHLGQHRFEHWLFDNQVYFITARCRDRFPAFSSEAAKAVFWERFAHCTKEFGFVPWVTSLLDNHYHTLGYLRVGKNLSKMMQRLHGGVSKMVNDVLPEPFKPFWREDKGKQYFDGCIRDEKQARLAFRYTCIQSERHAVVADWRTYRHTRINVELERAIKRSHELGAFLEGVPYKRYLKPKPAR